MKKALLGLVLLFGVAAAPAMANQPRAASFVGGIYVCPPGWTLVTTQQYVTYNVVVGYTLKCGPFGRLCRQVPVYQTYTTLVPANYCVPGVIGVLPQ